MSPELDRQLCEKYPKIFADRNKPMTETAMCWGFEHGDGWYNIIDQLCANIQGHIDWKNSQRELLLNDNPYKVKIPEHVPQLVASQVKEKFGTLRFYYDGGDEYIRGLVSLAESMSGVICEECGAPGQQRKDGWIRTLCDHHEAKRQTKLKERFINNEQ
jgi:hypothetical protein